jgi:hypothetical protein
MALFGERAHFEALGRARHEDENGRDSRHWLAVRREIARQIGKDIGLDTATRYLSR